jgi:3alpha(or 20beta)-hydroxysteroid dehydrogenase
MQERDWETAVNTAEKLGGLHGLVNNAGIYQPRTLMETDTELFERHTRVNQLGCFLGMKTVVPLMEQSGGGSMSTYHPLLASAAPRARLHTAPRNGR